MVGASGNPVESSFYMPLLIRQSTSDTQTMLKNVTIMLSWWFDVLTAPEETDKLA
jgi:hypothetical protein